MNPTFATAFKNKYADKLIFDTHKYVYSGGPDSWAPAKVKREALVQYCIKFKDGTEITVLMTSAQWYGIRKAAIHDTIKSINGEGHRKLKQVTVKGIEIYEKHFRDHEPFTDQLEIYGVQITRGGSCERFPVDHLKNIDFYSVYGRSEYNGEQYCLADCESLELAEQFAQALNIVSRYTLPVVTIRINDKE